MKTLQVSIYRFTELPEAAQERAVKLLSDIGLRDGTWSDPTERKFREAGAKLKIETPLRSELILYEEGSTICSRLMHSEPGGSLIYRIAARYKAYFDKLQPGCPVGDHYDDLGADLARAASVELTEARIRVTSPEHVRSLLEKSVRWFYADGAPYQESVL